MNKPRNMSRTRHSINRWSNLLQLFRTKSTKSFDSDQTSEICKPWRRRPSAMSDDSALSSTPSEECIIENFVNQFHGDYTHAVDEVRNPYFICMESTSVKKLTLHHILSAGVCSRIVWIHLLYQRP